MQNFIVSLRIPSSISFKSIRIFDKKMDELRFARVKFVWGADGAVDVATYEGRSNSTVEDLHSKMTTLVVAGFAEVELLIEVVA